MNPSIIVIAILAILAIFAISIYNNLVRKNEMIENAMSQIAAQLQSRWDALNNLIDATKDYAKYESETLDKITKNRTNIDRKSTASDVNEEENEFRSAMNSFYAVAENYPELKASEIYKKTMDSIDKYEDNVRHSRMIYNDTVTSFNRYIKSFPQNLFAGSFGFSDKGYFKNDENSNEVPRFNS